MVRNATTVAGLTEKPNNAYTPTLSNTSCTMAMMAARAIRHSSRQAMNSATSMRNTRSARIALSVMVLPHVELTELVVTSSVVTPTLSAKACCTRARTASGWSPTCTCTERPVSVELRTCTLASLALMPAVASTARASASVRVLEGTSHTTPPLNSRLRLRPRVNSAPMLTSSSSAEMPRPIQRRP